MADREAFHVLPVGDVILHVKDGNCICGPDLEVGLKGDLWVHHSLDGRENNENG